MTVLGAGAGSITIQAIYGGDDNNEGSSGTFGLTEGGIPGLTYNSVIVTCADPSVIVGLSAVCKVTVAGTSPTGKVTWSSSGRGKFSVRICQLSHGTCIVRYTPTSVSPAMTITASYSGDKHNAASSGTFSLTVTPKATEVSISCAAAAGSPGVIRCMEKVTGYSPTGKVYWSSTGTGSASLAPGASCSLVKGSCTVTFTATLPGTVTVQAAYLGDPNSTNGVDARVLTV